MQEALADHHQAQVGQRDQETERISAFGANLLGEFLDKVDITGNFETFDRDCEK